MITHEDFLTIEYAARWVNFRQFAAFCMLMMCCVLVFTHLPVVVGFIVITDFCFSDSRQWLYDLIYKHRPMYDEQLFKETQLVAWMFLLLSILIGAKLFILPVIVAASLQAFWDYCVWCEVKNLWLMYGHNPFKNRQKRFGNKSHPVFQLPPDDFVPDFRGEILDEVTLEGNTDIKLS